MSFIDPLFSIRPLRKTLWRLWYPFITRRLARTGTHFLNYAFETDPPWGLPLSPEDEPNRGCIQLYHHVASLMGRDLRGKDVLEVSCGHGGGAFYLTRTFAPASYTGLDLNPTGIAYCKKRHHLAALRFIQGDAENLPFPDASFDAVLNVEASHCYPDFPRFLSEVARVLRPGGYFHYADFRFSVALPEWERDLKKMTLQPIHQQIINTEVLRGMDRNSVRSQILIEKCLPKFLHQLGCDFAGIRGSRIYQALKTGDVSYRSFLYHNGVRHN
jgi:SAM-dependent methyltransferase